MKLFAALCHDSYASNAVRSEIRAGDYARQPCRWDDATVTFPCARSHWGIVSGLAMFDDAKGGELVAFVPHTCPSVVHSGENITVYLRGTNDDADERDDGASFD